MTTQPSEKEHNKTKTKTKKIKPANRVHPRSSNNITMGGA
jgi:hypothetical protein